MVHFYTFRPKEQIPGLIAAYEEKGFTVRYSSSCGNVAPGISRRVFDLALPAGRRAGYAPLPPGLNTGAGQWVLFTS